MRIAVVGGGIAGMGTAWALARHHQVTLFERNGYLGGHSNTVDVTMDGPAGQKRLPVDTGFIVYNEPNYPNLTQLFSTLGVETQPSNMSFAVTLDDGRLEYSGTDLDGLFGQRSNLVNPGFVRMLLEIVRFYREARALLRHEVFDPMDGLTLGAFLERGRYGKPFLDRHLLPMASAIWSAPMAEMLAFPMRSFARFFDNHGLLRLSGRPAWRTVTGGSRSYVQRIAEHLGPALEIANPATRVTRIDDQVQVRDAKGGERLFDHVVLACHCDEALALLGDGVDDTERRILSAFRFQPNRAYLHSDPALMPKRRRVWASWNYMARTGEDQERPAAVTYWMNALQGIDPAYPFFVTLNPLSPPDERLTHGVFDYDHPIFDSRTLTAQHAIGNIQGRRGIWYAGAWLGYGFHEDGLRSGLAVARALGAEIPWGVRDRPGDAPQDWLPVPIPVAG